MTCELQVVSLQGFLCWICPTLLRCACFSLTQVSEGNVGAFLPLKPRTSHRDRAIRECAHREVSMRHPRLSVTSSVTRLDDFWKFYGTNFHTKVLQILCWQFGLFWNRQFYVKTTVGSDVLGTFWKKWAPFSGSIWSHCDSHPKSHDHKLSSSLSLLLRFPIHFQLLSGSVTRFGEISPLWQQF